MYAPEMKKTFHFIGNFSCRLCQNVMNENRIYFSPILNVMYGCVLYVLQPVEMVFYNVSVVWYMQQKLYCWLHDMALYGVFTSFYTFRVIRCYMITINIYFLFISIIYTHILHMYENMCKNNMKILGIFSNSNNVLRTDKFMEM